MATGRVPTTANSPLTAKGDLFGYSTTQARVAVGNNGETLVADSSASTGLRWQGNFAAGKNKIINGDFSIWQRGTSFTDPATGNYTADRYRTSNTTTPTSRTISQQTFTPGTAPVAGYEGTYFLRSTLTTVGSSTGARVQQRIEDVRTLAGQTATLSFYAKSDSNRTQSVAIQQNFGSGGSATVDALASTTFSTTTSWTRFTFTFSTPSISGKTIGTNSFLNLEISQALTDGSVLDIWGLQLEAGSVATAFQTATGTLAGELAACQRYYFRNTAGGAFGLMAVSGYNPSATAARMNFIFPVPMRIAPTSLDFSNIVYQDSGDTTYALSGVAIDSPLTTKFTASVNATIAGGTSNRSGRAIADNNAAAFVGFSAEL